MAGFILIGIGVLSLANVIIFKKKINAFYDNVEGLSETHKKYYKNFVVYLIPLILIAGGIYYFMLENSNLFAGLKLKTSLIVGVLAILAGILAFVVRFTPLKYKWFAKLSVMEKSYGKFLGNLIHIAGYTLVPLIIGIFSLYEYFLSMQQALH